MKAFIRDECAQSKLKRLSVSEARRIVRAIDRIPKVKRTAWNEARRAEAMRIIRATK